MQQEDKLHEGTEHNRYLHECIFIFGVFVFCHLLLVIEKLFLG